MAKNIGLKISYDGTRYFGWQKTKMGPSIEEEIQKNLEKILQHPVKLQAASRTDRGVHALGQFANFFTHSEISLEKLQFSLNCMLSKEISILEIAEMVQNFHPTLHSRGKRYEYSICNHFVQLPHLRHFSWHVHLPLNLDLMKNGSFKLIGSQDFSSFCNVKHNEKYSCATREITRLDVESRGNHEVKIIVEGPRFMYKMVRNLVGLLVYVGIGKIQLEDVEKILLRRDRRYAGITAPAHGLSLVEVFY